MFPVLEKTYLSENVGILVVKAPHVSKARAGQFVMLQLNQKSENIPISILETTEDGFKCLIEGVGRSTLELLESEDIAYVAGPMGKPFPVERYGKVLIYAYRWGISPCINVALHLKKVDNILDIVVVGEPIPRILDIYGDLFNNVHFESEPTYRDGYDLVITAGNNRLSQKLSKMYPKVMAMVNTHMLDSIGLCLVCRVFVDGSQRLACVDGPWFMADKIDWENLIDREVLYLEQERLALEAYKKEALRKKAKEVPSS